MNKRLECELALSGDRAAFAGFSYQILPQTRAYRLTQSGALANGSPHILDTRPNDAVMEERKRLAREIHDTIAQGFAGILLHLQAAQASGYSLGSVGSECLARVKELAKGGLEDARRMLLDLRPKPLEGSTLVEALRQLSRRFSHDCGINCQFRTDGRAHELPEESQDELYRIAQEALCNVRKHSRSTSAWLSLSYEPGSVVLKITDNGKGFVKLQRTDSGYGLGTMRERAELLGGQVDIYTTPGGGVEVIIIVPCVANLQRKALAYETQNKCGSHPSQDSPLSS